MIKIIAILQCAFLLLFSLHHLGRDYSLTREATAYQVSCALVFVNLLRYDVSRTFQRIFHILHFAFHELLCVSFQVSFALHHYYCCQRLQSLLACSLGTSLTLRFEWQVYVFYLCAVPTVLYALA